LNIPCRRFLAGWVTRYRGYAVPRFDGTVPPSQEILDSTVADVGECSLEHLRSRSDEDIKGELLKFKGVGPKTAACVLMFSLGRFEFPVVRPPPLP